MRLAKKIGLGLTLATIALAAGLLTSACSSGSSGTTRAYMHYGAGYRGFYRRPWGYHPIYIGGGGGGVDSIDPDWGVEPPGGGFIAEPFPDMGMPDFDTMDMGGFDW